MCEREILGDGIAPAVDLVALTLEMAHVDLGRAQGERERVLEAGRLILETCVEAGGALTGEHGVGLEKLNEMELLFSPEDLDAMCRVRDVWDPERRMNPDKLVPLHACGELRTKPPREASR